MTTLEKINEISEILQQFQSALSDHMREQKSRRKQLQKDINKLEYKVATNAEKIIGLDKVIEDQNANVEIAGDGEKEKRVIQQSQESENEACVLAMLSEECDKELEMKETKLTEQTKRKHERESTKMEKRIHDKILKTKKDKKVMCLSCGLVSSELPRCENCRKAYYCDSICQKKNWPVHQHFCSSS